MNESVFSNTAICFLLIGQIQELPKIAIQSALDRTSAPIYIGMLDELDCVDVPKSERIHFLQLNLMSGDETSKSSVHYQDFSKDNFYQIVQYKWQLLLRLMNLKYKYILYSDTDVYWNVNPLPAIEKVFESRPTTEIQIQSFTDDPSDPKLCMGFVAFKVSQSNINFIRECASRHTEAFLTNRRIGDDDIVTLMNIEKGYPLTILELPQSTFPVGRMLKLYKSSSIMPGMSSPIPYIFHANYVVGLTNKRILIKLFMKNYSINDKRIEFGKILSLHLILKRIRQYQRELRGRLETITKSN